MYIYQDIKKLTFFFIFPPGRRFTSCLDDEVSPKMEMESTNKADRYSL